MKSNQNPDDAECLDRHIKDKQNAGSYSNLRLMLMRFACRYFKKPQEVEDVVQEAFVKLIEAQEKREISHPKSYLYQTVKNLSLNQLDKIEYRLTDTVGGFFPENVLLETPTMERQFESREKFELFCRAARQLPMKCRRVFILRRVYGFSQKEIAKKMGINIKTVEAHLTKAIVRCTDYMDLEENMGLEESRQRHDKAQSSKKYRNVR